MRQPSPVRVIARVAVATAAAFTVTACGGHSPIDEDTYAAVSQAARQQCDRDDYFRSDAFDQLDEEYGNATLRCQRVIDVIGSAAKFEVTRETFFVLVDEMKQTVPEQRESGRPASYVGQDFYALACDDRLLRRVAQAVAKQMGQPYDEKYLQVPPRHNEFRCEQNVDTNDGELYPTWVTGPA